MHQDGSKGIRVVPMRGATGPVDVFVSYAHEDEPLRRKLEQHLAPLQRAGAISIWHDRMILPGDDFAREIDTALEECGLVLLLVSAPFLASNYCWGIEMTRALERRETGECLVVPVILRPCQWDQTPIARIQALPRDARAVTGWENEDYALLDVANGIRDALAQFAPKPVVRGDEIYSPSSLVALRANSFLRAGDLPPRSLVLAAPDHAYLGGSFVMTILATSDDGRAHADVPIHLTVVTGTLTLKTGEDEHEDDGFLIVPMGSGDHYMLIGRSSPPRLVIEITAEGYTPATATVLLGARA